MSHVAANCFVPRSRIFRSFNAAAGYIRPLPIRSMSQTTDNLPIVPLLIGGVETAGSPSDRFPVYSYAQQKNVYLAESANAETAEAAADAAAVAFKTWKKTPAKDRRDLLLRYADLLQSHADELAAIQIAETSAAALWAKKNVQLAIGLIQETAACITSLKGEIPQSESPDVLPLAFTVPIGPVLVIAPWNSPIILGARNIATAVAAGCSVVFKASENCPKLHQMLVKIFEEAGLPRGVVNVIQASREKAAEVTEAVIAHPAIRKVEFVGSATVGRIVGQVCAKHLKPIFMELGGKGPAIVLDDADLAAAAKRCIAGAFLHHGQLCFSTERIIVLESIAAEFQQLLIKEAESFNVTDGVSPRIVQACQEKLLDAKEKGATFLVGKPEMMGVAKLHPTILLGLTKDMLLWNEESFGPSAALFIARDDQHAIELANDSKYGLNAAIHTKDFNRAWLMTQELEFGQVHTNNMTPHDEPTFPIGGVKGSGWGRNNALSGLREFSETRLMTWSLEGSKFV